MSRRFGKTFLAAIGLVLALCAGAYAISGSLGPDRISSTVTMQPRALPAKGGAPIELTSVTRIKNGDAAKPRVLSAIDFQIDKHGFVDAKGVPVCTVAKLEGTTPNEARKRCAGALVGEGLMKALVNLPGQPTTTISSPVSLFNGPKSGGQPSVIAHAYETVPAKKALVVPITVEKVSNGRYGYHVAVEIPEIAGGYGAPILAEATVGKTRTRGGKKVGYLNAFCSGGRLQVKGKLLFTNGDRFPALLTSPCHVGG